MAGNCDHNGFHSGVGKLTSDLSSIRFVLVCDVCGQETREVQVEDYSLSPDLSGNDAHRRRRAA